MVPEQLIFYPKEVGWLVLEGEVECQPVGVSRVKDEPGDEDGGILTGACCLESCWRGPAEESSKLLARV